MYTKRKEYNIKSCHWIEDFLFSHISCCGSYDRKRSDIITLLIPLAAATIAQHKVGSFGDIKGHNKTVLRIQTREQDLRCKIAMLNWTEL